MDISKCVEKVDSLYGTSLDMLHEMAENASNDSLAHIGTERSGRYPRGSGENPYQHPYIPVLNWRREVDEKRSSNFTYTDPKTGEVYTGDEAIMKSMNMKSTEFRTKLSYANDIWRMRQYDECMELKNKGLNNSEIARAMGYPNESSIRNILKTDTEKIKKSQVTAEYLKSAVDKYGMIDVGASVEATLGIPKTKLETALYMLEMDGYKIFGGRVPQATNKNQMTTLRILCKPDAEHKDIYNYGDIHSVDEMDTVLKDGGDTIKKAFEYPSSMDSSRLKIRPDEEGGTLKDGVIEIRPGVKDLDLGGSHYSQVRILVDDTHYLKGMAVYGDPKDFPPGVDVIFNSNKKASLEKMGHLKEIKRNPDGTPKENPFGSLIKEKDKGGQSEYVDDDGNTKLSLINKRSDEGDWGDWSNTISSQFLAKQSKELISKQLNSTVKDLRDDLDEINSLTNPTVKRYFLNKYAESADKNAVTLKAKSLPGQSYKVILPLTTIKDDEIYAPHLQDGQTVALIRYPHGSITEIPVLKVNNKNEEGKRYLGTTPLDAVGITKKAADQLSGADFDGDTVMVIPCNDSFSKTKISYKPQYPGLVGFDTKFSYGPEDTKVTVKKVKDSKTGEMVDVEEKHYYRNGKEYKTMKNTQTQMGIISNLIMDMTIIGADDKEFERAIRHSMVVIDAEKHHLDYRASELKEDIKGLKRKYQGHINPETGKYAEGASTLLTRAKSKKDIVKTKGTPKINDPAKEWYDPSIPDGSLIKRHVEEKFIDPKTGRERVRMMESTKMAETHDARTLESDYHHPTERLYADFANTCKGLANQARMEMVNTGRLQYNPSAKVAYQPEVSSLMSKINLSEMNRPKERKAQTLTAARMKETKALDPDLTKKEIKKLEQQTLTKARLEVGAHRNAFDITNREWEAIQAGAVSDNTLQKILRYADADKLRQLSMPTKQSNEIPNWKLQKIQSMKSAGYTLEEIKKSTGLSTSTISKYIKGGGE